MVQMELKEKMTVCENFKTSDVTGYKFGYHPFGKPKLFSHVYFVDGLLIDTGQSRMRKEILKEIKDLEVQQIYITHFHEDHTGNLQLLRDHFDCPSYASLKTCEIMKSPPPISFAQQLSWGNRPADKKLIPKLNSISTPNYEFQIISIPGHSPDMTALYDANNKCLFSADLYLNSHIGYFLKEEDIVEQISSIKKILKLDFDQMFCSHNPQLVHGKQKLEQKLLFLQDFLQKVSELYEKNFTAKQILRKLKLKEFYGVKFLSNGSLSKLNMVKSAIRGLERRGGRIKS